jgi:hypothetical protein
MRTTVHARSELAKAKRFFRRMGWTPRLWQSADNQIWVDETYQGPKIFEVTHAHGDSIRTDAAGLKAAIGKLQALAAETAKVRRRDGR